MKLATALAERSDIQNRINTISVRLDNNAKVQEGDVPAEDPKALMEELDRLIVRCLLYTSPSPRDRQKSRMPSSA